MFNKDKNTYENKVDLQLSFEQSYKVGFYKYLKALGGNVYSYGNATHALTDILNYIKPAINGKAPNILLPSFIPAKLYRITFTAGYVPVFYQISGSCKFNLSEIKSLIDKNTKAIFVVHYFGYPANIKPLKQLAAEKNIALIEDCAHVIFGNLDNQNLGKFGDYSIFSVRKMLVLSDGGYLVVNDRTSSFYPSYNKRVNSLYSFSNFIKSRGEEEYLKITRGNDLLKTVKLPERGYIDYNRITKPKIKNISRFSEFYSNYSGLYKHVKTRRKNYNYLFNIIKEFSFIKPLFNCRAKSWTPYSFPILVKEGYRDKLQTELLKAGISCGAGWPESPFEERFMQTKYLSQNLLELPVNPFISKEQLEKIILVCRNFESKFINENNLINNKLFYINKEGTNEDNYIFNALADNINIVKVSSIERFDELKEQWNNLCEKSDTQIFQTYEWQRLWWKHYGNNNQLYILLFWCSEKLVGIAPFFVDVKYFLGVKLLRRLRLIGSSTGGNNGKKTDFGYSVSDYLDIIILPGFEKIVADKLFEFLRENSRAFGVVEFDEAPENSNIFRTLRPGLKDLNWNYKITKREICPRIPVPDSLDDFMSSLGSKIRYNLKKIQRDILKDSLFNINNVDSVQDLGRQFEAFVFLHQQHWNAKGLPGVFEDNRFKNFLSDISEAFLMKGWLRLSTAYSNGSCVAVEYAFKYKKYYYDYLKAFDAESPIAKYSPGRALLLQLIVEAINEKASVVDLLRGSENYKFEIASDWGQLYKITIANPKAGWGINYRMFKLIFSASLLKFRIVREINIAKAQLTDLGPVGFVTTYFPSTFGKLKKKYFTKEPHPVKKDKVESIKKIKNKSHQNKKIQELNERVI